jgi:hypothetical protein
MTGPKHDITFSGAGWTCECGAVGWTERGAGTHMLKMWVEVDPIDKAVDEAWERNR